MAISFYNAGDNAIYDSGMSYVPQEKYRTGYTAPVQGGGQDASTPSFGIPNTNAFTNSGGSSFNQSGNAFGYGSPVSEVNVRTFNPQPYNSTGGSPFSPSFDPMANRESYGAQGQYNSPYDDTVDLGYKGRDTSTSLEGSIGKDGIRRVSKLGKVMDYIPYIGGIKKGLKFLGGLMPDNPNGPGGGTYGIGGLSDAQKEQYNALAKDGMLFSGSSGIKTSTGKNFGVKGYMDGQMDLAKGFFTKDDGSYMTDEEIEDEIKAQGLANQDKFNTKSKGFKYKQMKEASKMYKTNKAQQDKITERNTAEAAAAAAAKEAEIVGRTSQAYYDQAVQNAAGRDSNQGNSVTGFGQSGLGRDPNDRMAKGGRAGYFFGGRVNFKNGGLASIL